MSKAIGGYGPIPNPSFARRSSRATGPKIRRATHAPVLGLWANLGSIEVRIVTVLALVSFVVNLILLVVKVAS